MSGCNLQFGRAEIARLGCNAKCILIGRRGRKFSLFARPEVVWQRRRVQLVVIAGMPIVYVCVGRVSRL